MTLQFVGTSRGFFGGVSSIEGIDVSNDGRVESCNCWGWLFGKCVERNVSIVGMYSSCFVCRMAIFHVWLVIVGVKRISLEMTKAGIVLSIFLFMMRARMSLDVVNIVVWNEMKCWADGRSGMVSWCVCVVIDLSDDVCARSVVVFIVSVCDLLLILREFVCSVITLRLSC